MKKLAIICFVSLLLSNCGDFWEASEPQLAGSMTLQRDTIDLMVGDCFKIPVTFSPDSVSNHEVWWNIEDKEILAMRNDSVLAVQPGTTLVTATSVNNRLTSSCVVNVWSRWYDNPHKYPYDTVIYADITLDGEPIDDDIFVGAFWNDELRGVAKKIESQGRKYTIIRVWSPIPEDEVIFFRHYDPKKAVMVRHNFWILFTGNSYGTPSNPYEIDLN